MTGWFESSIVELLVWSAVLGGMVAVASYAIRKVRAASVQQELTAHELMAKFRESHSKGELSEAEFRTIKTTLAARFQQELKDDDETG